MKGYLGQTKPIVSLDIGDLIRQAKNKPSVEGREITDSVSTDTALGSLEYQADDLFSEKLDSIEKLNKKLKEMAPEINNLIIDIDKNINDKDKNERAIEVYLEDILRLCAKITLPIMATETQKKMKEIEKEKLEGKPQVAYSFAQGESWHATEDWELHHQYIYEVFNPQGKVYGPGKPKEQLNPGETLEEKPLSDVLMNVISKSSLLAGKGKWTPYLLPSSFSKKDIWSMLSTVINYTDDKSGYSTSYTVRKTEQAPDLGNIDVEDVLEKVNMDTPLLSDNDRNEQIKNFLLNLEMQKVIRLMATHVYNEARGTLQSDQIIELYDQGDKVSPRTSNSNNFFYRYTNYERRSKLFNKKPIKSNEAEPRDSVGALLSFTGQIVRGLIQEGARFGIQLYAAVVFALPQKCQSSLSN